MIATFLDLTIDLSRLVAIDAIIDCYNDYNNKIVFILSPEPQYVYNPLREDWEYHNENIRVEKKCSSARSVDFCVKEWTAIWENYKETSIQNDNDELATVKFKNDEDVR